VNTRYAIPNPKLHIRSVRQRIYQGFCWEADYQALFRRFIAHEAEILAVWRDAPLVEEKRRKKAVDYLEDFFKRISDRGRRERIVRGCREIPRE